MKIFSHKEIFILNSFVSALLLIQILFFIEIRPNQLYIDLLKYEILLFYTWCFLSLFNRLKISSLYYLFLFSFGLFILSRIFLDVLGFSRFEHANIFFDTYFSFTTQKILLSYILLFLITVHYGAVYYLKTERNNLNKLNLIQSNKGLENVGIALFILYFPIILAKSWIQVSFVLEHGYLAVFSGDINNISFPFWMAGASSIFDIAIICILSSKPSRKRFLIFASVYLIIQLVTSLIGGRARLILSILFFIWYYYKIYDIKIKAINIVYFLTFLIIFSQILSSFRVSKAVNIETNPLYSFFYEQGISVLVLGHMVNSKNKFVNKGTPYIFGGFNFKSGSNTIEHLKETNDLASRLTYYLSPDAYLNGYGTGSSVLGELYDLGIVGLVIIGFLLGGFIVWFDSNVMIRPHLFFFSMLIVQQIIWMPRSNLFPEYKRILVFLALFIFIEVIKSKKTVSLPVNNKLSIH